MSVNPGMIMAQSIQEALNAAGLYSDDSLYRFVSLPPNAIVMAASVVAEVANPFTVLLVDKDEVTLMIEEEDYEEYKKRFLGHKVSETRYRLITLDVELEATLIGFMATISTALAAAQITIMPFAAFSRDHLFIPENDFDKAIAVLEGLKR
jgi:hypothetical protein